MQNLNNSESENEAKWFSDCEMHLAGVIIVSAGRSMHIILFSRHLITFLLIDYHLIPCKVFVLKNPAKVFCRCWSELSHSG